MFFPARDAHSKALSKQDTADIGHPPFSARFQVRDTGDLPLDLLYSLSLLITQILLYPRQGVSLSAFALCKVKNLSQGKFYFTYTRQRKSSILKDWHPPTNSYFIRNNEKCLLMSGPNLHGSIQKPDFHSVPTPCNGTDSFHI